MRQGNFSELLNPSNVFYGKVDARSRIRPQAIRFPATSFRRTS